MRCIYNILLYRLIPWAQKDLLDWEREEQHPFIQLEQQGNLPISLTNTESVDPCLVRLPLLFMWFDARALV